MKLSQIAAVAALSLTASLASASVMATQTDASGRTNKIPATEPQRVMQGGPVQVYHWRQQGEPVQQTSSEGHNEAVYNGGPRHRVSQVESVRGYIPQGHGIVMKKAPTKKSDLLQRFESDLGSSKNSLSHNSLLRQLQTVNMGETGASISQSNQPPHFYGS